MKLQGVQNRPMRFITNRDWRDSESMQTQQEKINLPHINQSIQRRILNTPRAVEKHYSTDFERSSRLLISGGGGSRSGARIVQENYPSLPVYPSLSLCLEVQYDLTNFFPTTNEPT